MYAALAQQPATLLQIAGGAGGDHVVPGGTTATAARDQVVKGQVAGIVAILTGEAVAQEQVEPRKGRVLGGLHVAFQRYNAGQCHLKAG